MQNRQPTASPLRSEHSRETGVISSADVNQSRNASSRTLNNLTEEEGSSEAIPPPQAKQGFDFHRPKESSKKGRCLGIFMTSAIGQKLGDKELVIQGLFKELILYVFFLILLCIVAFGMTSSSTFYFTSVMKGLFVDTQFEPGRAFKDVFRIEDFWKYLDEVFLPNLYSMFQHNMATSDIEGSKATVFANRVIGPPRMRQLRMKNMSCEIAKSFEGKIYSCFDYYDETREDKSTMEGVGRVGEQWVYTSQDVTGENSYRGTFSTYSGGGYFVQLDSDLELSKQLIGTLKELLWLDRGTRAVFIDFLVYNPNINLFCLVQLLFEIPPTGGIFPSHDFTALKLERYATSYDYFVLGCSMVLIFAVIFYTLEMIVEIFFVRLGYFAKPSCVISMLVVLLCWTVIIIEIMRAVLLPTVLDDIIAEVDNYSNVSRFIVYHTVSNHVLAILVFFAWIKLFKYMRFNRTMFQLSTTLERCAKDVLGFSVMFFIVFVAFAQMGYLIFGKEVDDFVTFGNAVFTLLRIILGDFDFDALERADRVFGPIFFLSYVFCVFFMLLNMFLAIINDTYTEVKAELSSETSQDISLSDYFRRGMANIQKKLGRGHHPPDIDDTLRVGAFNKGDGKIFCGEIRDHLKRSNFSDLEIEMFFSKYDLDVSKPFQMKDAKRMLADLEGFKAEGDASRHSDLDHASSKKVGQEVTVEQFNILQSRVDRIEQSLVSIVGKIDVMLTKVNESERPRSRREEEREGR